MAKRLLPVPIELSVAGWFLLIAAISELILNRLASALGFYSNVGANGVLSVVAYSGRIAMTAVGIMSLVLACIVLPRLNRDPRFASWPSRIILMLSSPLYLPVVCVAIFRPVSAWLIWVGYMVVTFTVIVLTLVVLRHKVNGSKKRVILAIGLIEALAAFELLARILALFHPSGLFEIVPRRAYLFAEVLYVVTPIFAFLAIRPGSLISFLKRPHLAGVFTGIAAAVVAVASTWLAHSETVLALVAYRSLGITLALPGGPVTYIVSIFFGAMLVGSLIFPSRRWPPDDQSHRIGFGLAFVWMAGLQPTHPYLFILMLVGFLYLTRGLLGARLAQPIPPLFDPAQEKL
jgi:hypothetical protein